MENNTSGRTWPRPVDSSQKQTLCQPNNGEPSNARTRCNYGAEMENLDRLFGLVLDAVRERGNSIENDTIVCFFSDHGEMLNDHDDVDKSKPWQGALNVPLVCAGPGIRSNVTLDVPVATIDIGATMLDIAGAWEYRTKNMTAKSFRGLLEGADPATRNRTMIHSGLQKSDFKDDVKDDVNLKGSRNDWSFRLVVSEVDGPQSRLTNSYVVKGNVRVLLAQSARHPLMVTPDFCLTLSQIHLTCMTSKTNCHMLLKLYGENFLSCTASIVLLSEQSL